MVRYLVDASLHDAIVTGCLRREAAIDFLSAHEAGLDGVPDANVLALATEQDRILISHDFQTMPQHFGDFLRARGSIPGVLPVPQYFPIAEAIEEIVLIWGASDAEEWSNRILRIPSL